MAADSDNVVEFATPDTQAADPFADSFAGDVTKAPRTQPREIGTGIQKKVQGVADNKLEIDAANGRIIFYDENDVPRMMIGYLPDNTIAMAVSKVGIDVNTAFS